MKRNIVKAKLDIIFKKLFGDEKNKDILHAFISDILDIPYDSIDNIVIQNPELVPNAMDEKFSRMDVKLMVDDRLVNIEIQINNEGCFEDRTAYHWARLFTSDLKQGEDYGSLKQSITINIINFNMFECDEYHSSFSLREDTRHEKLTDKCAIHFFELKKIKETAESEGQEGAVDAAYKRGERGGIGYADENGSAGDEESGECDNGHEHGRETAGGSVAEGNDAA